MSYGVRERVKGTQYLWDQLTEDEKQNPFAWCPVSDELIREQYPGKNIDSVVAKMNDSEFQSFFEAFMRRYRARKEKRKSTVKYLRSFNTKQAQEQADRLEQEQAKEDKVAAEMGAAQ